MEESHDNELEVKDVFSSLLPFLIWSLIYIIVHMYNYARHNDYSLEDTSGSSPFEVSGSKPFT